MEQFDEQEEKQYQEICKIFERKNFSIQEIYDLAYLKQNNCAPTSYNKKAREKKAENNMPKLKKFFKDAFDIDLELFREDNRYKIPAVISACIEEYVIQTTEKNQNNTNTYVYKLSHLLLDEITDSERMNFIDNVSNNIEEIFSDVIQNEIQCTKELDCVKCPKSPTCDKKGTVSRNLFYLKGEFRNRIKKEIDIKEQIKRDQKECQDRISDLFSKLSNIEKLNTVLSCNTNYKKQTQPLASIESVINKDIENLNFPEYDLTAEDALVFSKIFNRFFLESTRKVNGLLSLFKQEHEGIAFDCIFELMNIDDTFFDNQSTDCIDTKKILREIIDEI